MTAKWITNLRQMFSYFVEHVARRLLRPHHDPPKGTNYYMLLLGLCCFAVAFGDSRLDATGVACVLLSALLLGLARILWVEDELEGANSSPESNLAPSLCGVALAGVLVLFKERNLWIDLAGLHWHHVALLVVNMASSAAAMTVGESTLTPSLPNSQHRVAAIIALVGFTGCVSVMLEQRSYTSILQFCSYGMALATLGKLESGIEHNEEEASLRRDLDVYGANETLPTPSQSAGYTETRKNNIRISARYSCTLPLCLYSAWRSVKVGVVIAAWIAFLSLNFAPRTGLAPPAVLDDAFNPNTTMEVVISMYQEPPASVASLISSLYEIPALASAKMHIYTKDATANRTALRAQTGAHEVTLLSNVGRESETYLHHILSRWESLANHTLFVQAEVHNKAAFLWRLETYFDPHRTGMLDLGVQAHGYQCEGSDRWGWSDRSGIVSNVYHSVYQSPCRPFLLSYKGQFVVSAKRIRGIGTDMYARLHEALRDPTSWAHQEPYIQGRPNAMSAPVLGYTVERLWNVLFQCSDVATYLKCPTFWSGARLGATSSDCQCVDRKMV
jgi:hypothetical protein